MKEFECKQPCSNCPYRTDAPLRLWHVAEFINLLEKDQDDMGGVFGCHKDNGSMCIGFLMDQDKRGFPSIKLRLKLLVNNVDRTYLDALHSPAPLFESIEEMCRANYPEAFKKR